MNDPRDNNRGIPPVALDDGATDDRLSGMSDVDFRRNVSCIGGVMGVIAMGLFFAISGTFTLNTLIGLTAALVVGIAAHRVAPRFPRRHLATKDGDTPTFLINSSTRQHINSA